jgi:hypothetical protein
MINKRLCPSKPTKYEKQTESGIVCYAFYVGIFEQNVGKCHEMLRYDGIMSK